MGTLYYVTQFTVPSGGITIPLGPGLKFWLSIAVDPMNGVSSGPSIVLTITGRRVPREQITVAYGAPALKRQFRGSLITVTGTGAVIELWVATEEVLVTPMVIPTTSPIPVNATVKSPLSTSGYVEVFSEPDP